MNRVFVLDNQRNPLMPFMPARARKLLKRGKAARGQAIRDALNKWERKCAYCGRVGVPLEIEHIVARSRGGSNRAGNLTFSCRSCNEAKGRMEASEFLKGRPGATSPAPRPTDAAAVNATHYAVGDAIKGMGLPTDVPDPIAANHMTILSKHE